jgi:excinuclease ABC subunit C
MRLLVSSPNFLSTAPGCPGVYQMQDENEKALYVGKAKNLKKRLQSYFRGSVDIKTSAMLARVCSIEIIVTTDEAEALLLECNLIKKLKPQYNIIFKDDRSYPYVYLSVHKYPALKISRKREDFGKEGIDYFGPFADAGALRETVNLLRKTFKIRQCNDASLMHRRRACLQYQIGYCDAPCVGHVSEDEYALNVKFVKNFFAGKGDLIYQELIQCMKESAEQLNFERAAQYRDQINNLKLLQSQQYIVSIQKNVDVLAIVLEAGLLCIDCLVVRNGLVLGNKDFIVEIPFVFRTAPSLQEVAEILADFIARHYAEMGSANLAEGVDQKATFTILTDVAIKEKRAIQEMLTKISKQKIRIIDKPKLKIHKHWLQMAQNNAKLNLQQYVMNNLHFHQQFAELQKILNLEKMPQRIECFDVSHHSGDATVASCVVFDSKGAVKNSYRKFKLTDCNDDYAAMQEVLTRHYARKVKEKGLLPDILMVDGGKGQLGVAERVLRGLGVTGVFLIGIAKDPTRTSGKEQFYGIASDAPLPITDTNLHNFLQRVRDEAHRFAISYSRKLLRKKDFK